jgi:flagellar basal body rod protein FlgF
VRIHFVREEDDLFARDGVSPFGPGVNKPPQAGPDFSKYIPGIHLPPNTLPKTGPTDHPFLKVVPPFPDPLIPAGPLHFVSKIPVREHGTPLPKLPPVNLGRRELDERGWLSVAETVGKDALKAFGGSNSNSQQKQQKKRELLSELDERGWLSVAETVGKDALKAFGGSNPNSQQKQQKKRGLSSELDERGWLSVAETVGKDAFKAFGASGSNSNSQQKQQKKRGLLSELDERGWLSVADTVGKDAFKAFGGSNSNSQQKQQKKRGLLSEVGASLELREEDELSARNDGDLIYGYAVVDSSFTGDFTNNNPIYRREYAVGDLD